MMKEHTYIGIGASAGGLKAFEQLIPLLPIDKEYIYIIAQHLDPKKQSALAEILSKFTSLSVSEINKETIFSPNHIYIVPRANNLVFRNNMLELEYMGEDIHSPTPSVDKLFEALAHYKGKNSIGIILSGAGCDGSKGIRIIKEYGGVSIAQEPTEAKCKSMPESAIEAESVDYTLSLEEIAQSLASELYPKSATPILVIQKLLQKHENFNITKYKSDTILRRINKRMLLVHKNTLVEYVNYLKSNKDELHLLYQNILIGVTRFFRDKDAFERLEKEICLYLKDKPDNYEFKIWSIACSTGEEAYSIAILMAKINEKLNKNLQVKIFASDIDEKALAKARTAIFSKEAVHEIDKETLFKYFTEHNKGYKVIEKIRNQIVFTKHNILSDPPFINQDIISCRNLLIYIKPEVQQEIFKLLHYTLKDNGLLFLGSSESTLISIKYFLTHDSEHKIYAKEKMEHPPKISSHYFSKHLEEKHSTLTTSSQQSSDLKIEESISNAILDYFIPNCIVIDKELNIVYKKGDLPFVQMPDGFITLNILDNLHKTLQFDVRRTISLALTSNMTQTTKFIELILGSEKTFVRVVAYPYTKSTKTTMLLLYFQQLSADDLQFNTNALNLPNESVIIKSLTAQLAQTQEDNNILSDKLVVYKENMQLLNEELQSSNEELQSSNEELETSNEELQSSNEELHVSIKNEQKIQEKLSGILNASQNGIIGLDMQGNHTFVNDATIELLGFSRDELIANNAHKLWHHTKADGSHFPFDECKLHNYLATEVSLRTQDVFWKKDGTSIEVEVLQNPLIQEGKVVGAVLSFHDVTEKNRLKREAQYEHQLANLYVNIVGTLVMTLDLDGNITMINPEGAKLLGLSVDELIGKNWFNNFIDEREKDKIRKVFESIVEGSLSLVSSYKNSIIDVNHQEHIILWRNNYIRNMEGEITGVISSGIDITKEERLSQKLFAQEHLYKLTFEEANIGIAHTSLDGRWIDTNEYMSKLLGYTKKEFQEMNVSDITYTVDIDIDEQMQQQLLKKDKTNYHIEKRYIHKDGTIIWVATSVVILKDDTGHPLYFLKIVRDISQLKLLMYQLEEQKDRFEKIINFTPTPIMLYSEDGEILFVNKMFIKNSGYSLSEVATIDKFLALLFKHEDEETLKKLRAYYKNPVVEQQSQQSIITRDGEKRVGILNAVELDNTDGSARKLFLVAIVDITDLQKKDELMVAQSRQAAMGDMLAMIAHQWRQPLSVISMLANNIKVRVELQEDVSKEDIDHLIITLNKQTQYLSQTIDDFRDFFKPDKVKELVNINTIIEKVENLMLKSLQNNNITLEVPSVNEIKIPIYINQLIQVILNLINNAKDAIKTKEINDGVISIDVSEDKNNITISICDNGGGIDKSIIDRLGQPYVSTKSKNSTGLGLYMSIMIVENHLDGKLQWKSDAKGSCFYIILPVPK